MRDKQILQIGNENPEAFIQGMLSYQALLIFFPIRVMPYYPHITHMSALEPAAKRQKLSPEESIPALSSQELNVYFTSMKTLATETNFTRYEPHMKTILRLFSEPSMTLPSALFIESSKLKSLSEEPEENPAPSRSRTATPDNAKATSNNAPSNGFPFNALGANADAYVMSMLNSPELSPSRYVCG